MIKNLRFRFLSVQVHSYRSNWFERLSATVKAVQTPGFLTQTLMVGVLATALWLGSVGTYTEAAHAGDNLNARPYAAEAVRQSRSPASRENSSNGMDLNSKAPEDLVNEALESAKDAVKDALPGMSADRGMGQNANNPNTQHSSNPKR